MDEYEALKLATISFFYGLSDKSLKRIGTAN